MELLKMLVIMSVCTYSFVWAMEQSTFDPTQFSSKPIHYSLRKDPGILMTANPKYTDRKMEVPSYRDSSPPSSFTTSSFISSSENSGSLLRIYQEQLETLEKAVKALQEKTNDWSFDSDVTASLQKDLVSIKKSLLNQTAPDGSLLNVWKEIGDLELKILNISENKEKLEKSLKITRIVAGVFMACSTLFHIFGEQFKQWLLHINWAHVFKVKNLMPSLHYEEEDEGVVDEKEDFVDYVE